MRTTQRDDAPVTGFFEFQLITRCKHRLEGGKIYVVRLARSEGDAPFDAFVLHDGQPCTWDEQLRNVSGQVASSEPPFEPMVTSSCTNFGRSSRKFSKLARPHREIFVYLRMELNGISSIRVLHPRHLRLNVRDTRDGRLLARCANKRRVAYILVPENYTFLGRILFRGYDENTRV